MVSINKIRNKIRSSRHDNIIISRSTQSSIDIIYDGPGANVSYHTSDTSININLLFPVLAPAQLRGAKQYFICLWCYCLLCSLLAAEDLQSWPFIELFWDYEKAATEMIKLRHSTSDLSIKSGTKMPQNGQKQMKLYATRDEARPCRSVTYWFRGVYLHPLLSRLSPNVNLNILSKLVNWTLCTQSRYNNPHSDYIIAICSARCNTSQKLWATEWMINEMIFGRAAPWHGYRSYRTRLQHQVPHF